MNLIIDPWLPVITHNGQKRTIKPAQLSNPDIAELDMPRLDFQGAAYQLLIGLLQTTFAPNDIDEWIHYYESPPDEDTLQQAFDQVIHAFYLTNDSVDNSTNQDEQSSTHALFMQDLDTLESAKNTNDVASLLIEAPGANTTKLNKDFFVKRELVNQLSLPMAAMALFTLQINAPSGGSGHRTGLRGGGPMTTLVRPNNTDSNLWEKLWWNVINRKQWQYSDPDFYSANVFPWLAATRMSDTSGEPVYRDEVHPLHVYWAMPRRIRLIVETVNNSPSNDNNTTALIDDLTGQICSQVIRQYRTQNYGANYEGDWSPHPITPYRFNPKKPEDTPYSIKAQPGGINYKIWHMLTFTAKEDSLGCIRAMVLDHVNEVYEASDGDYTASRLWAFSFDMDNMKARGFYSKELPIYYISEDNQEVLLQTILELHKLTENIVKQLRSCIKYSWMSEQQAKDNKGDMSMIDTMFWQRSEPIFFSAIDNAVKNQGQLPPITALQWLNKICKLAEDIFEQQVLSTVVIKQQHMKELSSLRAFLYGNKQLIQFRQRQKANTVTS